MISDNLLRARAPICWRRRSNDKSFHRELDEKLTRLTGEDNLVGSWGEYGLLLLSSTNSPRTKELDGEPALSLEDIESMFVHKRFPEGWESWKKTRVDWLSNSTALMVSAGEVYLALQRRGAYLEQLAVTDAQLTYIVAVGVRHPDVDPIKCHPHRGRSSHAEGSADLSLASLTRTLVTRSVFSLAPR
jgi:hypothetical protein